MTTATWSNLQDMSSDAAFRVICLNISTNLAAIGWVQSADTGQINLATVTKPVAINTAAGYQIWEFTDTVRTVYMKLEYGTAASCDADVWPVGCTFGSGSNGSGTITGLPTTRTAIKTDSNITSAVTQYGSAACQTQGGFNLLVGIGSALAGTSSQGAFAFARTCDSSGNATGDGYELCLGTAASTGQVVVVNLGTGFTIAPTAAATISSCLIPFGIASSNYGTGGNNDYQVWRHELPMPQTLTSNFIGTGLRAEIPATTTFPLAIVGATTHTYISFGAQISTCSWNATSALGTLITMWE